MSMISLVAEFRDQLCDPKQKDQALETSPITDQMNRRNKQSNFAALQHKNQISRVAKLSEEVIASKL